METYKSNLKKVNKIIRIVDMNKLIHKKLYYYNDGQVKDMKDIRKDDHKYTIIKLNTKVGEKKYLVFVNITINDNFITHQLLETYNDESNANKYFMNLIEYINNTPNEDILNKCYKDLSYFNRKNLFKKLIDL